MQHADDDSLAALALGLGLGDRAAPGRDTAGHVAGCPRCSAELATLSGVVRTARESDLGGLVDPPPRVWQRVVEELDLNPATTDPASTEPVNPEPVNPGHAATEPAPRAGPPRSRRPLTIAAGALVAAVATAVLLAGTSGGRAEVVLDALDGGVPRGEAVLGDGASTRSLVIDTTDLPPTEGFYEVWLLDPAGSAPVPLGALDDSGQAWLAVPDGVDLATFTSVDVSVEPRDGDPTHSGASVLRGSLPQQ